MGLDEVEREVGEGPAVVVALPRPRVRNLGALDREPVGVEGGLLLEVALERVGDVLEREGAYRAAGYGVRRSGECAVDQLGRDVAVLALDQLGCGLYERERERERTLDTDLRIVYTNYRRQYRKKEGNADATKQLLD